MLDDAGKRLAWWVPVKAGEEKKFGDPDIARRTKKQDNHEVMEVLVVADPYNVTGAYLTKAEVQPDHDGRPCIVFTLNDAGGSFSQADWRSSAPQVNRLRLQAGHHPGWRTLAPRLDPKHHLQQGTDHRLLHQGAGCGNRRG